MATTYASPGVYVEEVQNAIRPIQAVGTSMPAFIGMTEDASTKKVNRRTGETTPVDSVLGQPTLISTWTQFTRIFGGFADGIFLPDAVYAHFTNGGGSCYVLSLRALNSDDGAVAASCSVPSKGKESFTVSSAIAGESGNGMTVTITHENDDKGKPTGAFTLKAGKESISGLTLKKGAGNVGDAAFKQIAISNVGAATAVPDEGSYTLSGGGLRPLSTDEFSGGAMERSGLSALEAFEEIRLITCPDLMVGYDGSDESKARVQGVQQALISHCEKMRYRFAILDTPPGLSPKQAREWRLSSSYDTSYAAMYYPWVKVADLSTGGTKTVPPSGHMAGVYGRVDAERGVFKAPANEALLGVNGLELQINRNEQDILNPIGVNCIRAFPGRGIRVWGARTLSSDGAWRYISVRRLFIMVAASMDAGLQWVVFEPNDSRLWSRVRRDVNSFLRSVWRSGGMYGENADQAYYIKCDAELNTDEVRDAGQMLVEVGIAPVKPAEFVIFRLSQWSWVGGEEDDDAFVEDAPPEDAPEA